VRGAQPTSVIKPEGSHIRSESQVTVAHWRNNQIPDQSIDARQCLLDTASVRAVGDIQFCSDFETCQENQVIVS